MSERELRAFRRQMQIVFQDPHASLNPAMTIEQSVGHPLQIHRVGTAARAPARVAETLETVGLAPPEHSWEKYPSDLSGGQKQRAVIARAIILNPVLLVADEPVSMLDMSVRAKILELMLDLKRELDLTYLYITHDLATAKFFCDRIAILYLGRIVEIGPSEAIYADPKHPYTKALLRAIPEPTRAAACRATPPRRGARRGAAAARLLVPPALPEGVRGVRLGDARPARPSRVALGAQRPRRSMRDERASIGDLASLDTRASGALRAAGGAAEPTSSRSSRAARDEAPDEPFWRA